MSEPGISAVLAGLSASDPASLVDAAGPSFTRFARLQVNTLTGALIGGRLLV
jgi:hypothetical protein